MPVNKTLTTRMKELETHVSSLYTEIETVCKSVEIQRSNISGLNAYRITNDKNITLLFDRVEEIKQTQPTLLQLFKAVLYIPFTTVTKGH